MYNSVVNVPEQPWIPAPEPPQKPTFSQSGNSLTFTNIDKDTRVIAIYANNYLIGRDRPKKLDVLVGSKTSMLFHQSPPC